MTARFVVWFVVVSFVLGLAGEARGAERNPWMGTSLFLLDSATPTALVDKDVRLYREGDALLLSVGPDVLDVTAAAVEILGNTDLVMTGALRNDGLEDNYFTGRMGLGKSNPSAALDVLGNTILSANLTVDSGTLFVDAANNRVGVGTTGPAVYGSTLVVAAASAPSLSVAENSVGAFLELRQQSDAAYITRDDGDALHIGTKPNSTSSVPSPQVTVLSNGNVGIGTSAPGGKLEIGLPGSAGSDGILFQRASGYGTGFLKLGYNSGNVSGTNEGLELNSAGSAIVLQRELYNAVASPSNIKFFTAPGYFAGGGTPVERMRIDRDGNVGIGTSMMRSDLGGLKPAFQIERFNSGIGALSVVKNSNDSVAPYLFLGKSRGTANGQTTILQGGDRLGFLAWMAADGSDLNAYGAAIFAEINGTPSANNTPTDLIFSTNGGSSFATERMRITSSGNIGIGTATPGAYKLNILIDGANDGLKIDNGTGSFTADISGANTYLGASADLNISTGVGGDMILTADTDASWSTNGSGNFIDYFATGDELWLGYNQDKIVLGNNKFFWNSANGICFGTATGAMSYDATFGGAVYVTSTLSAATIVDRTPGWSGSPAEALAAVAKAKSKPKKGKDGKDVKDKNGQVEWEIDHASLHPFARHLVMNESSSDVVEDGRNIGNTVTLHGEAIKALLARVEALEARVAVLEGR